MFQRLCLDFEYIFLLFFRPPPSPFSCVRTEVLWRVIFRNLAEFSTRIFAAWLPVVYEDRSRTGTPHVHSSKRLRVAAPLLPATISRRPRVSANVKTYARFIETLSRTFVIEIIFLRHSYRKLYNFFLSCPEGILNHLLVMKWKLNQIKFKIITNLKLNYKLNWKFKKRTSSCKKF